MVGVHSDRQSFAGVGRAGAVRVWLGRYLYLIQVLAADLFGMLAFGKILGAINILDTFGGAMGPVVTGIMVDRTEGYLQPFIVIVVLLLVATIAAVPARYVERCVSGIRSGHAPDAVFMRQGLLFGNSLVDNSRP